MRPSSLQAGSARHAAEGGLRPRQHDERMRGEARQQLFAQPAVEWGEDFVGIDEQDDALVVAEVLDGGLDVSATQGAHEASGDGSKSRPSRLTTRAPESTARRAKARSRWVLPMPPGP